MSRHLSRCLPLPMGRHLSNRFPRLIPAQLRHCLDHPSALVAFSHTKCTHMSASLLM